MDTQKELHDYLVCALWSSTDDNADPLDSNYSIEDIAIESIEQAQREVASFMDSAVDLLSSDDRHQVPGHDFWLTRNGHGAWFWDGDYVNGDELTKLSEEYGEVTPYIGDDGKIYFA